MLDVLVVTLTGTSGLIGQTCTNQKGDTCTRTVNVCCEDVWRGTLGRIQYFIKSYFS